MIGDVPPPVPIPHDIDGITPAWLTQAMQQDLPGLVIDTAELTGRIPGASTKARFRLRTNRNDAPVSVIVKAGYEPHSAHMRPMHDNEMHAYRDLIPTLRVNAPHCYFAGRDVAGYSLVIIEDLDERGVRFLSLQEPIGFELAQGFLDALARIHARWWGAEPQGGAPHWIKGTSRAEFDHYFGILEDAAAFDRFAQSPRCAAMPRSIVDSARVQQAFAAMRAAHAAHPSTVNHGDMHLGNLYVDADGTPGLLDWQPRLAPWALDVSYFLTAGLDLLDRRRWEGALLQHYLAALRAEGVEAPAFDEAWDLYRRTMPWGLTIWMLNGTEFQTEARNTAAAVRFAMAMIDHDVFRLLGV